MVGSGRWTCLALQVDPNPLLDLWVFASQLPAPLGELATSPAVTAALDRAASAPLAADDEVRQRIRGLLRAGGFKPTGRSKPASEYLLAAAAEAPLRSINPAVDAGNAVSLHSGVPVSVVDLGAGRVASQSGDRAGRVELRLQSVGPGHRCRGAGLPARRGRTVRQRGQGRAAQQDRRRDARDALDPGGTTALPGRAEAAFRWYGELLASMGIAAELVTSALGPFHRDDEWLEGGLVEVDVDVDLVVDVDGAVD